MTKEGMYLCTGKQGRDNGVTGSPHPCTVVCHYRKTGQVELQLSTNPLSPQGYIKPRWALQHFLYQYTHKCLHLFSFSYSGTCSAASGVSSAPNATVLPGGPHGTAAAWAYGSWNWLWAEGFRNTAR